jgi:hypothetical protein
MLIPRFSPMPMQITFPLRLLLLPILLPLWIVEQTVKTVCVVNVWNLQHTPTMLGSGLSSIVAPSATLLD